MATISTQDAQVSGGLTVSGDRATLLNAASITAHDHTAALALTRGGEALVCATSQFHLYHSGQSRALVFGLDRGAIQLATPTQPDDIILTPDIRFAIENRDHPSQLDLRLRVTRSGDTCVDNHGAQAPVLMLSDSFSGATYRLLPNQHVLFEHGDLRQVVDNERASCGCPDIPAPQHYTPAQLAAMTPSQRAAAEHPFPAAASEDLTATAENPPTPAPGQTPADATTDFRINAGDTSALALTTTPAGSPLAPVTPASTQQQPHGFFHSIGRFFRRLFS
jgi:hypothetical protein